MFLMIENIWLFLALLPVVSFLYSAVGHGGASGYLALMALFAFPHHIMKPTALLLNIVVAGIAFYFYYKQGYFRKKLFLYFAMASIPLAYLGGSIHIDASIYKKILALLLVFAILKMLGFFGKDTAKRNRARILPALLIGSLIGFFSGLIGIGGGIILTPVILLLHWGTMKEAAAVSALFIWVNSVAAMAGHLTQNVTFNPALIYWVLVAITGGLAGGYYGSKIGSNTTLKYVLAFVLIIACVKLVFV